MKQTNILRKVIRAAVFVSAVLMIIYGIYRGEMSVVFHKAARICFECIGLGR